MTTRREDTIRGLRDLADWLENHDTIPVAGTWEFTHFPHTAADPWAEVRRIAAIAGVTAQTAGYSDHYIAHKPFGPVAYRAVVVPEHVEKRKSAA
jgi:hypothetical protein